MTVPYKRITSRVDIRDVPCLMCDAVTVHPVIDHCHEHGWTRGVLCMSCNNTMARVDADLSSSTARALFHRDNCPSCRRDGYAGVTRRLARHGPARRHTGRATTRIPVTRAQDTTEQDADLGVLTGARINWHTLKKAEAMRRVDQLLPARTASRVVVLLAGLGVAVTPVDVRKTRQRSREAHSRNPPAAA